MRILFDSRNPEYKIPFGCVQQEEPCRMMIRIPREYSVRSVTLVIEDDMSHILFEIPFSQQDALEEYDSFAGQFMLEKCGLYYYYFHVETEQSGFDILRGDRNRPQAGNGGKWQLTCYLKGYRTPDAFQGKVMYQIFPDRFCQSGNCVLAGKLEPYWIHSNKEDVPVYWPDEQGIIQNNDFFGGNLKGITEKIPYLASLHVSVLYLNPIFLAYSNHRYDTCDYKRIDPLLGTEGDFVLLCRKAHEYGMKVLLDGVFSHTGDRSVYFDRYQEYQNGAFHHPDSPYRSWYQFDDSDPNGYHSWWGIKTLPCTEELDPGFLDYVIDGEDSVAAHWIKLGADGFRLDVADELPDAFITRLHRRIKQLKSDAILLGEVWEDASNKISYSVRRKYFVDAELDSVMNYPFKDAVIGFIKQEISSEDFSDRIMTIIEHYPKPVLDCVMNSLSTHDTMRILTVLGASHFPQDKREKADFSFNPEEYRDAIRKLKAAAFLQYILPGCPCIYYGDEAGMEGFEDPFNRRFFPWGKEDPLLLGFYRKLGKMKQELSPLQIGNFKVLSDQNGVFVCSREQNGHKLIAIVSMREHYDCFTSYLPFVLEGGNWSEDHLSLERYGFVLLNADEK